LGKFFTECIDNKGLERVGRYLTYLVESTPMQALIPPHPFSSPFSSPISLFLLQWRVVAIGEGTKVFNQNG
jgi:hypothetical protein